MFGREKIAMLVAEFLGAALLSTVTLAMLGRTSFPFFVAAAAGVAFGAMAYLFGAHSNPAVTIGLWTMRKVQSLQAVAMIAAQMLGGVAAWKLTEYLLDSGIKNIAGDSFDWRILLAEAIGAFVLGLGVAVASTRAYTGAQWANALGVSLFLGVLVATFASNGVLNPAVAVGVQSWNWAYALGPVLGGVVGMSFYGLLFVGWPVRRTRAAAVRAKASTRKTAARKTTTRKTTRSRR